MVVASRVWRLHLREVEQRAEEAERTRDEVARRRAVEERLRIARELHDSLTHNISVICVQSGVAVHLARKRGEEVSPALLAIQEASADAARELRTTLGVLRSDDDGDTSGLSHLDRLTARARASGLPVTVNVTGAKRTLPPEVDQAAYRIVQEALTNVSRHAGPASAWVHLCYTSDALEIQIDDDGAGISIANRTTNANGNADGTSTSTSNANGHGHGHGHNPSNRLGLMGMRERVTALGGRLHAGPRDGGGFQVRAEIPAEIPAP
jgi:signal transduction histidine kinase